MTPRGGVRQAWCRRDRHGDGRSIPFHRRVRRAFPHAKILGTGWKIPNAGAASNESLHLGVLDARRSAEALLLANLG